MTKIKTLTIQFDTPLHRSEIPLFRGAVIAVIPSSNILFHNHNGTALRYKEKCADSDIMPFSLQEHQDRATPQEVLFLQLNKELFNINTK